MKGNVVAQVDREFNGRAVATIFKSKPMVDLHNQPHFGMSASDLQ